jgi:diguanylate cyclase (GGDEF)-like protein
MFEKLKNSLSIEFLPQRQEPHLYAEMAGSPYGDSSSLFGGAVLGSIVAFIGAYMCGNPLLDVLAGLTAVSALARIVLYLAFKGTQSPRRQGYAYRPWEYAYAAGAGTFSILLGVSAMVTLTHTPDMPTTVMMVGFVMGYSCGIAARNSLRPWISSMQMWFSMLPLLWTMMVPHPAAWAFIVGTLVMFVMLRKHVSRPSYDGFLASYHVRQAKEQVDHQFDLALRNMSHGLALFDRDARMVFSNDRMASVLGLGAGALRPGATPEGAVLACKAAGTLAEEDCPDLAGRFALGVTAPAAHEFEYQLRDGRTVEFTFSPISGAGGGTVAVLEDITERKQVAARIEHLAHFDSLTGLPNRFTFKDRLNAALRKKDTFAVLAIDLDKFKAVNDTLGHSVGDRLLIMVADRLREMAGSHDTVSRFGGDEFMVILGMIQSNDDVAIFARRVVNYLSRPYLVDQHSLNIGASVGIAIGREHASDAETLLQYADMALYRVKADTRGDYKFFEAYMDKEAQEKRVIELDLRHAIARKELEVHFQPQIKIATGKFTGAEALVRWRHPTRGFVSPEIFIRVAEETGMIVEIGEWVLRESCLAAKAWPNDMRVAVNLSAVQFHAGNLVQTVRKVLNETGFPAQRLELEITESLLMSDKDRNGAIMRELNEMGIRISLDDFGKGFSSLSYLKDYTFDKIKVDKDFVDQIGINPKAEAIIRAVACLGLDMQMSITVEGVESAEQVKVVTDLGCTDIQGWYYSKALPQQALLDFLTKDAASRRPNALAA